MYGGTFMWKLLTISGNKSIKLDFNEMIIKHEYNVYMCGLDPAGYIVGKIFRSSRKGLCRYTKKKH